MQRIVRKDLKLRPCVVQRIVRKDLKLRLCVLKVRQKLSAADKQNTVLAAQDLLDFLRDLFTNKDLFFIMMSHRFISTATSQPIM